MSLHIEYQKNGKWGNFADTSDPEAWYINGLATIIKEFNPNNKNIFEMDDDDLGLIAFEPASATVIRKYLINKGQTYRGGMDEFLTYLEKSNKPVLARLID